MIKSAKEDSKYLPDLDLVRTASVLLPNSLLHFPSVPHWSDLRSCLLAPFSHFCRWQRQNAAKNSQAAFFFFFFAFAILLILRPDSQLAISPDSNFYQRICKGFPREVGLDTISQSCTACFMRAMAPRCCHGTRKRSQCKEELGWTGDLYGGHFCSDNKKAPAGWIKRDRWLCLCAIHLRYTLPDIFRPNGKWGQRTAGTWQSVFFLIYSGEEEDLKGKRERVAAK